MKTGCQLGFKLAVLSGVACLALAGAVRAEEVAVKPAGKPFVIFDNMHYVGGRVCPQLRDLRHAWVEEAD